MTRGEALNECVSRDKAIVQLNHLQSDWDDDWNVAIRKCIETIKKLPSVTPQQKMGLWITWKEAGNDIPSETRFECSVCHDAAQTLCNGLDLLSTYCPNCGAKMQEVKG